MTFLVIGGVLFIAAGRLDWPEAWAFLIAYFVIALVTAVWMLRRSPELTQERARPGRNAKSWDNVLVGLNLALTLALFAVIGRDAGRCGWSEVPLALRGLGLLGFIPAFGLPLWAEAVIAYLSSRVRIQTERGHAVVAAGQEAGATYQAIPDASHNANQDNPAFTNRAIREFLQERCEGSVSPMPPAQHLRNVPDEHPNTA